MRLLVKVFLLFILSFAFAGASDKTVLASWELETDEPTIIHDYTPRGSFFPAVYAGNIDCEPNITELYGGTPTHCRISTSYGTFVGSDLARSGTLETGRIFGIVGHPLPIPNSPDILSWSGNNFTGYNLFIYRNVASSMETRVSPSSVSHRVNHSGERLLERDVGSSRISRYGVSFSSNTSWLFTQTSGSDLVRLDLSNGEALYFGESIRGTQRDPLPKTAISDSGRFAAIGSGYFRHFRLYDLSRCMPEADGHNNCPYINLQELLEENGYPGFTHVRNVRFRSESSVYVKFAYTDGGVNKEGNVLIIAPGYNPGSYDYLALGDSFASGEGAFSYKPETDTSVNGCRVSKVSYPFRLGAALGLSGFNSVACSGARIDDVFFDPMDSYEGQVDETVQENRSELEFNTLIDNLMPGYLNQSSFVAEYRPRHITVSAVGNDIGFDSIIRRCVMPGTCYSSQEDRVELVNEINRQIPRMSKMYRELVSLGHEEAHVYAIGYPQFAKAEGSCGNNVRLNYDELSFASQLISYLNEAIEVAARQAGATYVDVEDAFAGHRLCETTSSPAMHGLTAGTDTPGFLNGPFGKQSYHPTSFGHLLLAARISEQTNQFNLPAPTPESNAWFTDSDKEQSLYVSSPDGSTGRTIRTTHYDTSLSVDYVEKSQPLHVAADSNQYTLQSNHSYEVWLHSDPVFLGEVTTDENGKIDTELAIPANVADGYHALKIIGEDIAGNPVTIHKTVFVSDLSYDELFGDSYGEECLNENGFVVACDTLPMPPDSDKKPPINNPETEAGNEQQNEQHKIESQPTNNQQVAQSNTATTTQAATTSFATESQLSEESLAESPASHESGPAVASDTDERTGFNQGDEPEKNQRRGTPGGTYAALLFGLLLAITAGVIAARKRKINK